MSPIPSSAPSVSDGQQIQVKSLVIEPKLTGQMNYSKWVFKMTILLKAANLWVNETNLPKDTSVSLHAILSNVDDGVSDLLLDCTTASSAWSLVQNQVGWYICAYANDLSEIACRIRILVGSSV
jgi:hypothetical protein